MLEAKVIDDDEWRVRYRKLNEWRKLTHRLIYRAGIIALEQARKKELDKNAA